MKTKLSIIILAVCTVISCVGPIRDTDLTLEEEFVHLERAFIPPLFFSNKLSPAFFPAMRDFLAGWGHFKAKYRAHSDHPGWQPAFDRIQSAVDAAAQASTDVKSTCISDQPPSPATCDLAGLSEAHQNLEEVRDQLLVLHQSSGITNFATDQLDRFHASMEKIALTLKDQVPGSLDATTMVLIAASLQAADKSWREVERQHIDRELWHLTDSQLDQYATLVKKQRNQLDSLAAALNNGDQATIIASGSVLKPTFANIYRMFGDFSRYAK